MKIAIVCSSNNLVKGGGEEKKTGVFYEELASPFYTFKDLGNEVEIVSIKGGEVPLDPASVDKPYTSSATDRFDADESALKQLKHSHALNEFDFSSVDAIFFPGGHGLLSDIYRNEDVIQVINGMYATGKIVGAVCHGPLALVGTTKENGDPILKGTRCTGFSTAEEAAMNLVPLAQSYIKADSPEMAMVQEGGQFEKATELWGNHVVTDGNVVTGQNPASSKSTAEAIIAAFDAKTKYANKEPKGFEKA